MADLVELRDLLRDFNAERDWEKFHSPRNLLLALTGEVGELAASVQWVPDSDVVAALAEAPLRDEFSEELADCLIYLVQIADVIGIDLEAVTKAKVAKNALKYPADLAKGRSTKYTQLIAGEES